MSSYRPASGTELEHDVIPCQKCGQKLRIPSGRHINVSCPKCRTSFEYNSDRAGFIFMECNRKAAETKDTTPKSNSNPLLVLATLVIVGICVVWYAHIRHQQTNPETQQPQQRQVEESAERQIWVMPEPQQRQSEQSAKPQPEPKKHPDNETAKQIEQILARIERLEKELKGAKQNASAAEKKRFEDEVQRLVKSAEALGALR